MGLTEIICIFLLLCSLVTIALLIVLLSRFDVSRLRHQLNEDVERELSELSDGLRDEMRASRTETAATVQASVKAVGDALADGQRQTGEAQNQRLRELTEGLSRSSEVLLSVTSQRLGRMEEELKALSEQERKALEGIRDTVQTRLETMQQDNAQQLERMRATVDEKLQKTLDDRITQSFQLVNQRLQEVYSGLGEMKTLASGVGDLKKVLSNVKTRGIMGELQLGAIIEELLPREQYEENVVTKPGSSNRVEFAIRLPGADDDTVLLPIDAKFPADVYHELVDAYDSGEPARIAEAGALLDARIKGCARDIHDKYIDPPHTTDFAIMFLPFEGLYAEVVRRGLSDAVQRQYKVSIAGPTTFAALLNSLQMGFRTLAIQKRSGEVWNVLGAVKTEFATFQQVLEAAQKRIEQTGQELDKLVGVRTRKINSRLRQVSELPAGESAALLDGVSAPEDEIVDL